MSKMCSDKKGQLTTLDLIVSSMIFLSIVVMFMWSWGEANAVVMGAEQMNDYRHKATDLLDILLKTRGMPEHWEDSDNLTNVSSLGLVSEPGVLDRSKLRAFEQMPYQEARRVLGLTHEGYYMELLNKRNRTLYTFGRDSREFITLERPALLDGDFVTFKLGLFDEG